MALGLNAGDKVDFVRMKDGNYALLPATHSIRTLKGYFYKSGRKCVSLILSRNLEAAEGVNMVFVYGHAR